MINLSHTPWDNPSQDDQVTHAILHICKAAGKLAAIVESEGHGIRQHEPTRADMPKYCADLVICSIRLSELVGFGLEQAVKQRQAQRNPSAKADD